MLLFFKSELEVKHIRFKNLVAVCFVGLFALSIISGTYAAFKPTYTTKNINVKLNDELTIALDSNPSTGYEWYPNYDTNFLEMVSSYYIPSNENCGAPGTDVFVFKALKTGETDVIFKYQRIWDPNPEDPLVIYHITVTP